MRRLLPMLLVLTIAACDKAPPIPTVIAFADRHKLDTWFHEQCSIPRHGTTTMLEDYTLPAGMETVSIFTVPEFSQEKCGGKLVNLMNVRVEIQSGAGGVCAVRLGPADALAAIDPTFIADWFSDAQLGARARALVDGGFRTGEYTSLGLVDGIRVAVAQHQVYAGSQFFLVVDGCGHGPDSRPGMSHVY